VVFCGRHCVNLQACLAFRSRGLRQRINRDAFDFCWSELLLASGAAGRTTKARLHSHRGGCTKRPAADRAAPPREIAGSHEGNVTGKANGATEVAPS